MSEFLAFTVLAFGFFPLGLLITLNVARALLLAPIISLALAAINAQIHVVFDVPLSNLLIFQIFAQTSVLFLLFNRKARAHFIERVSRFDRGEFGISALALAIGALSYAGAGAPVVWDARSIWLSKASWLNGPASQYLIAQEDNLSGHPDYPLAGPSIMATYWNLEGVPENLQSGVALIAFLPVVVIAFAVLSFNQAINNGPTSISQVFLGFLLIGSTTFIANGMLGDGYMDVTLSTSIVALALVSLAFFIKPKMELLVAGSLLLVTASNLKQEGQIFALVVIAVISLLVLIFSRRLKDVAKYLGMFVPVFLVDRTIWQLFSNYAGLPESSSTTAIFQNLGEIFQPSSRFYLLLSDYFESIGFFNLLLFSSLAIMALLLLWLRWPKLLAEGKIIAALALPVSSAMSYIVISLTYTLGGSRDQLDWWLGTSYLRITASPELLLIGGIFVLSSLAIVKYGAPITQLLRPEDSREETRA